MCYKSNTWMNFLITSKKNFDEKNIKLTNNHNKEVILIEPVDKSIMCEYVIKNVMYFLHNDWNLTILHGNKNKEYFENMTRNIGTVKLINLNIDNFAPFPREYNKFLTSKNFYSLIENEIFMIIQLDVLLFKKVPDTFLKYSYVGAPWKNGYGVPCGNGGLSIRNKSDMLKILNKFTWNNEYEDIWFCKKAMLLNLNICPKKQAELFSSETIFNENSCGVHKPHFNENSLKIMINKVIW
jgi:hypothetical protein